MEKDKVVNRSALVRRVEAVVNVASGSVGSGAAEEIGSLASELGITIHVASVEPKEVEKAVRSAVDAGPDLVAILAGDGTARLAAQLCGSDGPLVAPLPGGTMNILPKALYGDLPWLDALRASLFKGRTRPVSGGEIEGHSFYVAAVLGAPALWAPAREAMRNLQLGDAWRRALRAFDSAFSRRIRYALEGDVGGKTEALALLCPLTSKMCDDEAAFEAAALDPQGAAEAFRLGFNYLRGDWRQDQSVDVRRCQSARVWANSQIPCILDGEMHMLARDVGVAFKANSFQALVPASDRRVEMSAAGSMTKSQNIESV
jgi:diacylglycerol kinase family enzyme